MDAAWEAVIGLEVHAQLATGRKLFCACRVGDTCPICLAHPGTLPTLDPDAVTLAVRAAVALGGEVHAESAFDRKHYASPDLPKGYQITQQARPLATGGEVHARIGGALRCFALERLHLEEDAGRTVDGGVDFGRAGAPLIEIVGAPELRTPEEAEAYLRALHRVLVVSGVCEGELEKGHFRCDANVSVRRSGEGPGARVEIKNVNGFRFVARALRYEIARQTALLEAGGRVERETRGWIGDRTLPLRAKEAPADYRYLPEPDLPPLRLPQYAIATAESALPCPAGVPLGAHLDATDLAEAAEWRERYGLTDADAATLRAEPVAEAHFRGAVEAGGAPRAMAAWVMAEVLRRLNATDGEAERALGQLRPAHLAQVQALLDDGAINRDGARAVIDALVRDGGVAAEIAAARGLTALHDDDALRARVAEVLAAHPVELARARAGARGLAGFFTGRVMEATGRRADPRRVARLVAEAIDGSPTGGSS